jgi:ribosome biogenesis GTPase
MRWTPARVISGSHERYRLAMDGFESSGRLAGRLRHTATSGADLPVVGDWVLAALSSDRTAIIQRRLTRRSCLSRGAAGRAAAAQAVAANVDTALLVTSCNRDFSVRRIERYLTLAREGGIRPVVLLNKADLCSDPEPWRSRAKSVASDLPVLVLSALRGDGLTDLREMIDTSGTAVLLGSSGVGKSTLLNALLGEERQRVLPARDGDDRGRHSTTARELFVLNGGGILIDTPGMREVQLSDAKDGLDRAFADIGSIAAQCRFRDCSHLTEPGCAVRAAIDQGILAADRLDSYQRLQRENDFARARHDQQTRSSRTRHAKQIAKAIRLQEKLRRR